MNYTIYMFYEKNGLNQETGILNTDNTEVALFVREMLTTLKLQGYFKDKVRKFEIIVD